MQVFAADLRALRDIRTFAETWGRELGLDEDQRYRMKLAASEAAANAIEHPQERSDLTVWAMDRGDRFTLDLWHGGEFVVKTGVNRRHRGMGLPLMLASVDEVMFASLPEGGTRVSLSMFLKDLRLTNGVTRKSTRPSWRTIGQRLVRRGALAGARIEGGRLRAPAERPEHHPAIMSGLCSPKPEHVTRALDALLIRNA